MKTTTPMQPAMKVDANVPHSPLQDPDRRIGAEPPPRPAISSSSARATEVEETRDTNNPAAFCLHSVAISSRHRWNSSHPNVLLPSATADGPRLRCAPLMSNQVTNQKPSQRPPPSVPPPPLSTINQASMGKLPPPANRSSAIVNDNSTTTAAASRPLGSPPNRPRRGNQCVCAPDAEE